jgi:ACS family glucarate transporter-like MFS transporter
VSVEELEELQQERAATTDTRISFARVTGILLNRNVLMVTLSYAAMNYTYYLLSNWSFLYLIQEQHFTVLEGGWMASLPPLGAALGAGLGGVLTEVFCRRLGVRWGYRLTPVVSLPLAGLFLLGAISVSSPYAAVACLVLSFSCVELTEASYWAATMRIAKADTMAATGVLNTGGNLGGIVGIPIVAYLSGHQAWNLAFITGLGFAVVAALLWLRVQTDTGSAA